MACSEPSPSSSASRMQPSTCRSRCNRPKGPSPAWAAASWSRTSTQHHPTSCMRRIAEIYPAILRRLTAIFEVLVIGQPFIQDGVLRAVADVSETLHDTVIRGQRPGEDLHERALARTVPAHQPHDLGLAKLLGQLPATPAARVAAATTLEQRSSSRRRPEARVTRSSHRAHPCAPGLAKAAPSSRCHRWCPCRVASSYRARSAACPPIGSTPLPSGGSTAYAPGLARNLS